MIDNSKANYYIEKYKAEGLNELWKIQLDELSILKSFCIENGSIPDEVKRYLYSSISRQKKAYEHYINIQYKSVKEIFGSQSKRIKSYKVLLKEVGLPDKKIFYKKGTVVLLGPNNKISGLVEEELKENGYMVEKISSTNHLDDKQPLSENITGFIIIMDGKSKYEDFKSIYFQMKSFMKDILNNCIDKKFVMGVTFLDGKLGLSGTATEVIQGSVGGLIKSLSKECTGNVNFKVLDLNPEISLEKCKKFIYEELNIVDDCIEISIDKDEKRWSLFLEEDNDTASLEMSINKKDVFLVSGGGSGITAQCIMKLCKKSPCGFIILGRSNIEISESEDIKAAKTRTKLIEALADKYKKENIKIKINEISNEANRILRIRNIKNNIKRIEALGGKVFYCSCNILNEEEVKTELQKATKKLGEITGVIHGAGVIRDKKIYMKTEDDFKLVYGTKCIGIQNILKCLNLNKLKYITFFSSIAAYFGNNGQTDYAAANEYLNKLSFYLKQRYPQINILSINWAAWNGGMVNDSLKKVLEKDGHSLISIDDGTRYFLNQFTRQYNDEVCQKIIY